MTLPKALTALTCILIVGWGASAAGLFGELGSTSRGAGAISSGDDQRQSRAGAGLGKANDAEKIAALTAEVSRLTERNRELEVELVQLREELNREATERVNRELEWLDFTTAFSSLDLEASTGLVPFTPEVMGPILRGEDPHPKPVEPDPGAIRRRERGERILSSMGMLLRLEMVHGIDPLDLGSVAEEGGWVGPVVFRLLDEDGHLAGSLTAERLRLEASTSALSVTIVLEEGAERRAGIAVPFEAGIRRMHLPRVDPRAWLETMPELFSEADLKREVDDGLWELPRVRRELDRLLTLDAEGNVYRLRNLGGVVGDELCDVQLAEIGSSGKVVRRIFADRMQLEYATRGMALTLFSGASVRGDEKRPFLDGRLRILLPSARQELWRAAILPGLLPEDALESAAAAGNEVPKENDATAVGESGDGERD